jgi:DNA-binding PadR family transcriptional regulator
MLSLGMPRAKNISRQTRILLSILVANPQSWRHGYELSKLTELKSGTLYPLLIRLSEAGFLESKWLPIDQPGRPPRHVYRLTPSGLALARAQCTDNRVAAVTRKLQAKPA